MIEPKLGLKESHYSWSMRQCNFRGIKVYPINISGFYHIEIDYRGWIWNSEERFKAKARFKKDKHWHTEVQKIYQTIQIIKQMGKKNILEEVAEIIYNRDNEKAKDYGDFHKSMSRATKMFNLISNKHMTTRDFYIAMMALKLTRLRNSNKHDTYLDLIAYTASMSTLKDKPLIEKDFE